MIMAVAKRAIRAPRVRRWRLCPPVYPRNDHGLITPPVSAPPKRASRSLADASDQPVMTGIDQVGIRLRR